jgi:hypothetical protein
MAVLATGSLALTGCLHIIEDVTLRNNGSGTYKMTLDMSEVKGMMEMLKTMAPDSAATDSTGAPVMAPSQDNQMAQMGQELSGVATTLKGVQGITNVIEKNDTSGFQFGYSFDFVDVAALNRALRIINKEKYDSKTEEIFRLKGKSFERLSSGDIGAELKKALAENEGDSEEAGSAEMMQMFFADMTYKQVYHFPDRTVKKSTNELSEVTDDGHTLTITLKPFDAEQQKKKMSVATAVKLK